MAECVEPKLTMVATHATATNAAKWQFVVKHKHESVVVAHVSGRNFLGK